MLSVKLTNCRECSQIPELLKAIDCKLALMANNLYLNMAYMLDKPVEGANISRLIHYKRILTYKYCNPDYALDFSVESIGSRVRFLTYGCKCCDQSATRITTTSTTTVAPTTTTTTTIEPVTTTTTTTQI